MNKTQERNARRFRRRRGIRKRVFGTSSRPRLTVFRSNRHTYAQIVDDLQGKTLLSASTMEKASKVAHGGNADAAVEVGKRIAERAKQAGIEQVTFDRAGFRYHGRIRALADAAREGGLKL